MGGAWISGLVERAGSDICKKPRASRSRPPRPGVRGVHNSGLVRNPRENRVSREPASDRRAEILAFLAPLVSASLLFVLLRGARPSRPPGFPRLARCETDRVRLLVDWH